MRYEIESPRLDALLNFVAACAPIQDLDSLICLLNRQAHGLLEFQHLSILLCNPNREILKTISIGGRASSGAVEMCMPMVSTGRMLGALCIAKAENFSDSEIRLVEFLADSLAGTFDRLAHARAVPLSLASLQNKSRRMSHMAQHDALTGLSNRWLLNERFARALALSSRHGRRLAVLFLDVDRFKNINDSLGHGVGDQVLREISERLVRCVRTSDTVSRIGGDEFVVLLSEVEDEKDAMKCAEKLNAEVQAVLNLGRHELRITVSIGISLYPGDGDDAETLLRNADAAMYRAKREGAGNSRRFRQSDSMAAVATTKSSVGSPR